MRPVNDDVLNDLKPLDSTVLDELSDTLISAASLTQEAESDWRDRAPDK